MMFAAPEEFNSIIRGSGRLASSRARKAKNLESLQEIDPNFLRCKWEGIRFNEQADCLAPPSPVSRENCRDYPQIQT